jgi:hypothetical protein
MLEGYAPHSNLLASTTSRRPRLDTPVRQPQLPN